MSAPVDSVIEAAECLQIWQSTPDRWKDRCWGPAVLLNSSIRCTESARRVSPIEPLLVNPPRWAATAGGPSRERRVRNEAAFTRLGIGNRTRRVIPLRQTRFDESRPCGIGLKCKCWVLVRRADGLRVYRTGRAPGTARNSSPCSVSGSGASSSPWLTFAWNARLSLITLINPLLVRLAVRNHNLG
jgi:hypothetical protein